VDDLPARLETSLPPPRDNGEVPPRATAEEHQRWRWESRLKELVVAETKAWKRFAWGAGICFGLLLLILLGVFLAGIGLGSQAPSAGASAARVVGLLLQVLGVFAFWALGILDALLFVLWINSMYQRRRFSSTPVADPGQLPRR